MGVGEGLVPSPTDEEERFWVPRPFSQPCALPQPFPGLPLGLAEP